MESDKLKKALKEEGWKEIEQSSLRTKDYKEVIEYYNAKTHMWEYWAR